MTSKHRGRWAVYAVSASLLCACDSEASLGSGSEDTSDVTGTYTVNVYYGENGCALPDWPEGDTLAGIALVVRQKGNDVTAVVEGIPGAVLGLIHGSNMYAGSVKGTDTSMVIYGTIPQTEGNCPYTYNNYLEGTFDEDFFEGKLRFEPAVSDNPDCSEVKCTTWMSFNGARAPSE